MDSMDDFPCPFLRHEVTCGGGVVVGYPYPAMYYGSADGTSLGQGS